MTRICEKFVDELTSSSGQFSPELREHLTTCPECKLAVESLRKLKTQRKPMTGKEAAAIAGILKAVRADAASADNAPAGGKSPFIANMPRYLFLVLLTAAIVTSLSVNLFLKSQTNDQQLAKPAEQTGELPALSGNDDDFAMPEDSVVETAKENTDELSINKISDNINLIASTSENPGEANASETSKVKMVSPDQEDIRP